MIRSNVQNHLLSGRQIFNQFIVDCYAKIEAERLLFLRINQTKLRVEEYVHLRDAVANDGNPDTVGTPCILPSTFIGSPRQMHENTQDAMTYVKHYGTPDLFITFTCNPAWQEIQSYLSPGQNAADRHDLVARVFRQKQLKFIAAITKHHVFGDVRCWMYTIEYQKRGPPHPHNLFWLKQKHPPSQIDHVISAELPDQHIDPNLYNIVTKNMVHGPCGVLNPSSPCMREGKCTKRYPKQLLKETQTGYDGYPLYRRRGPEDGGFTATLRRNNTDIDIDNRWIVPYSPLLSKMFQAHINVEYCNSVKSIKYICKYINKGPDMAVFGLSNTATNDEKTRCQLGRYICSNESVWRILSFPIHERHPQVMHLSVHLENGQRVYFTAANITQRAQQPPTTTLTAFFQLCQQDDFARTLLYVDVPRYYTYNKSSKKFNRRKLGTPTPPHGVFAGDTLGTGYTVHPNNAECYYLRLLLHNVLGPTSFDALKTVEGESCSTFREACLKLGLLESDQHWDHTMREAQLTSLPQQMRQLFAIILTACQPANPLASWDAFKEPMTEDILIRTRRLTDSQNLTYTPSMFNSALIELEDLCMQMGTRPLSSLGLPTPQRDQPNIYDPDYLRELSYDLPTLQSRIAWAKPLLNDDQKAACDTIMENIQNPQTAIIFLDAPGGTGKTFLTNLILAEIISSGDLALATASSGIAATLLNMGRTAHSALKLPLNIAHL